VKVGKLQEVAVVDNDVAAKLKSLGVDDDTMVAAVQSLGATSVDDLAMLREGDLTGPPVNMPVLKARRLVAECAPEPSIPAPTKVDPAAELPDGADPSASEVSGFASQLGVDPTAMMMFMGMSGGGMGGDFDLSGMIPIQTVVNGYNPKLRNMFLMVMGQIENRLGVPIVVIDNNGAVNRELTTEYIEALEEGHEPAENNIYFGTDAVPHEVIRVGVDAQSIYDADPLVPTKALPKNNIGTGRVNWTGVSLEVRQVTYYAVTATNEIDPTNDAHQAWLRDHVKKSSNRLIFHGQAPRAMGEFNEAARTGSLPTLRVMLARGPRKKEIMPRRRRGSPKDLSGIGGPRQSDGRDDL